MGMKKELFDPASYPTWFMSAKVVVPPKLRKKTNRRQRVSPRLVADAVSFKSSPATGGKHLTDDSWTNQRTGDHVKNRNTCYRRAIGKDTTTYDYDYVLYSQSLTGMGGSRDRENRPILIIPHHPDHSNYGYQDNLSVLSYLASVPGEKDVRAGFTIVIDMRNAAIKQLKTILKVIQIVLYGKVARVLIVKPEQFFEKQRLSLDLKLEAFDFKVRISISFICC
ncbi:unnamed protein product [Soboliphyme baturini]|uniref:CRAL-TRIO domain-containing protein n=1 Tax=Soboliphyme baturini TaxID=241478 RepID=A0A183IMX5_9BILA|nr:unnamed protein product [Soboliphyme baturini]